MKNMVNLNKSYKTSESREVAESVFHEIFTELFWTIYRKDDDFEELKNKSVESGVFKKYALDDVCAVLEASSDDFRSMCGRTKEEDDEWIEHEIDRVVSLFLSVYPEYAESIFTKK